MQIKIHSSCREVVAICDTELLGKQFEEENKQLNIKESFYKGEEVDEEKIINLIKDLTKEDATFNIVGEKSCEAAIKAGIITKNSIGEIDKVRYALVLL
jgi:uncharacterized protein